MTELEQQLLSAFEQLSEQQEKQQREFVTLYNDLAKRFSQSQQDNAKLQQSVSGLTVQVQNLAQQLQQLQRQYSTNRR
ncbi:MbeD/MobD family mobilization/exclusion protein [Vibrio plantisponsor]|uniref:MbeD/MobD family mobilization/exclusion protein n=1 Tax=Vibrio plantisponsor TaxID=664643 RepID=UPI00370BE3D0